MSTHLIEVDCTQRPWPLRCIVWRGLLGSLLAFWGLVAWALLW
jgi:hypothetical protein